MSVEFGILHMTMKVVYTFLMRNPQKWAFHFGKCKAVNEACLEFNVVMGF